MCVSSSNTTSADTHRNCATDRRGKKANNLLRSAMMEQILILMQLWHSGHAKLNTGPLVWFCLLNWAEWCPKSSKDLGRGFMAGFHHFRENVWFSDFVCVCVWCERACQSVLECVCLLHCKENRNFKEKKINFAKHCFLSRNTDRKT